MSQLEVARCVLIDALVFQRVRSVDADNFIAGARRAARVLGVWHIFICESVGGGVVACGGRWLW